MSEQRRLLALLELADEDARAAQSLARDKNRYAAYHCQQAVEKLLKALLIHHGIEPGAEHRLEILLDRLPEADPWRLTLVPLKQYTAYATTYRYTTVGGRITPAPDPSQVAKDAREISKLVERARQEIGD
jgi:HEPN domain-containing protein